MSSRHFVSATLAQALCLCALAFPAGAQEVTSTPSGGQTAPPEPSNAPEPAPVPSPTTPVVIQQQPAPGGKGTTIRLVPAKNAGKAEQPEGYYYTDDIGQGGPLYQGREGEGDHGLVSTTTPPAVHVVRKGDTLWDICFFYFNNPWAWPKIWSYNPSITNPHWIYPGDVVRLYPPGGAPAAPVPQTKTAHIEHMAPAPTRVGRSRPQGVELRQIAFVSVDDLNVAGTVAGSTEEKTMLAQGDEIFIDYPSGKPPQVQKRYAIYSPKNKVVHPETGKVIGYYVVLDGEAQIESVKKGKRAMGLVTYSTFPIERGDRVGNMLTQFKDVTPVAGDRDLSGVIVGALEADQIIGARQVVFLDKGAADGVRVGNRFLVVRRGDAWHRHKGPQPEGDTTENPAYPAHAIARVMVLETGKHTSVGMVTASSQEIEIGDHVVMRKGL